MAYGTCRLPALGNFRCPGVEVWRRGTSESAVNVFCHVENA